MHLDWETENLPRREERQRLLKKTLARWYHMYLYWTLQKDIMSKYYF